ncbi:type II toxin-antitoxin system RelE/ParE family toxin [Flavobacterium sp. FlaQc-57]|uniref:type II toxin-antitoxin system RelE/ParE family toxin n=1 Tax=Flavobacterium sp. FlaQc-57 TaxID=3374186 RepID=UPI003757A342
MKISFTEDFLFALNEQVDYIARDKPKAARKFKNDLIQKIKKDIQSPYSFKKSIYFNDETIRDYAYKGYTAVYKIDKKQEAIFVLGFIKYKDSL